MKVVNENIIEVNITSAMKEKAQQLTTNNYFENKSSLIKGNSLFTGYLGEIIFESVFTNTIRQNCYDYDFVFDDNTSIFALQGKKIDCKVKCTTYGEKVPPLTYNCSVMAYSLKQQKNDYYCFIRLNKEFTKGWIVGFITKERFKQVSIFIPSGNIDKNNGWLCKMSKNDCFISDLDSPLQYLPQAV